MNEDEEEFVDGQSPLSLGRIGTISEKGVSSAQEMIQGMLTEAKDEMKARGILDAPRPKNHPEPLADLDINSLTNQEVASLYTKYVGYSSYIGDELAEVECLEHAAKKLLRETLGELKDAQFVKGVKGAEATTAAMKNPLYKELELEHTRLYFMTTIMKRKYSHYVQQAKALSRTVELRKLDFENHRRDSNIGRGKTPSPTGFGSKPGMGPSKRTPGSG